MIFIFGVFGVWLFFDNLNHFSGNKTTLDLITKKKYHQFFVLYLVLLLASILIEVIGSIILKLWSYPKLWAYEPLSLLLLVNGWGYLSYPIILMSFKEMYSFVKSFFKNKFVSVIISMLMGIIIWEVPNLFSRDWVYNIPYIHWEIFQINVVVIIGWIILILGPFYLYKLVDRIVKK